MCVASRVALAFIFSKVTRDRASQRVGLVSKSIYIA